MRVEFNQGVPDECINWLWTNVGPGNVGPSTVTRYFGQLQINYARETDAWFYKRERQYPQPHEAFDSRDMGPRYVPTITVKDPKLGILFVLRWS